MRRQMTVLFFLLVPLFILATPAGAQEGRPPAPGRVVSSPCPILVPDTQPVDCAYLEVPENYDDPGSSTIRLPFIILRSTAADPAPDPILYTVGGPGYSSLGSVWGFVNDPLAAERDVIIFEQRGNRHAQPSLVCDESAWWEEGPEGTPCLDAIQAQGIDLSQYIVQNIVRDIIALRQALGYDQWNLIGTSFSTSLMLMAMEADGPRVRSAILYSVKPPHMSVFNHEADSGLRAIQTMLDDCAADSQCAAAYPDLDRQFHDLVRQLNDSPLDIKVWNNAGDQQIPLTLDGDMFIDFVLIDSFYRPAFPPHDAAYLPLLIDQASRGNMAALRNAAQNYWLTRVDNDNWALSLLLAVNCQQDLPAAAANRPASDVAASEQLDGFFRSNTQRSICAAWDLPAQPMAAADYIQSDVPTLVLAGAYDPVTPPAWSKATADHLSHSTYVEFPGAGHDLTIDNPCASAIQVDFLADPGGEVDLSCVESATPPTFALPGDLYIAPGLANSGYDISIGGPTGNPWLEAATLASIVILLLAAIILVAGGLLWLLRRRTDQGAWDKSALAAYLLALLVIAGLMAVPALTTQINAAYFGRGLLSYALGPSRDFGPASTLAWLAPLTALLVLALGGLTLWAWLARRWSIGLRLVASLVVLASLMVVVIGLRWGLFTMLM